MPTVLLAPAAAAALSRAFLSHLAHRTAPGDVGRGVASASNLVWTEVGQGIITASLTSASYLGSGMTASGTAPSSIGLASGPPPGSAWGARGPFQS